METINPKSMFTKGQTAYSIALLSYKDDETEKIITHTISKVGRSFVYDEKETKYHYSNKYKAFISADAFHHQQAIFPTEKAVQEYLERSRLYFDLIRLNSSKKFYDEIGNGLQDLKSNRNRNKRERGFSFFFFCPKNRLCIIFFHTNIVEKGNEKNR